jgi:hypothetical protein
MSTAIFFARKDRLEKFDRLGRHVTGYVGYAGNVSSGMGKTFNEA